ncbi:ABC transporter substrate-binding protein [Microbacterium sp. PRC9]|uniref:ABC transporter substrate-binding protein n=1 Tax=Microbacterium sp. PRC9 TaxID=2962591 RepID=UPI002881D83F|nr:ABC transporter substrate-binding protein [Microbacterium sp. PRC9]MDT0144527.1 ABC transporter substrate-binding protein [Microbacterium sp. PRC9]
MRSAISSRGHGRGGRLKLAAAAAVVVTLALAGCSSSGSTPEASGTPGKGGTLTVGEQQAPPTLDPGTLDSAYIDFTMVAYDPLFYLAPDGSVEPRLAESWEYEGEGNTVLDVTLRDGVTFSDGDELTADAVKASLEYARDSEGNHSALLADLTFEAVSDLELKITSAVPNPLIPWLLTQQYPIGQIISPTGLEDPESLSLDNTSHGAGAYIYDPDDSVVGDHYTYTANPDYYDKSQQYWDKVVYKITADAQAALNAAKTGQIDVYKGSPDSAQQAQSAGLQVIANPGIMTGLFLTDRDGEVVPALADPKVRQAINYAIDRDAITKAILGDMGTPTFQTAIEGADGYSEAFADYYTYDPDKAKELLAEAGYPDGFEMKVQAAVFVGFDIVGEAIAAQLAEVGITMTQDVATDITVYQANITGGEFPGFVGGYKAAPMYQQGKDFWLPGSNFFNPFHTESAELTDLWNQAAGASDDERADLDAQMQEYIVENAWFAPVFWAPVIYFAAEDIGGVETSAGNPFASPIAWYPAG